MVSLYRAKTKFALGFVTACHGAYEHHHKEIMSVISLVQIHGSYTDTYSVHNAESVTHAQTVCIRLSFRVRKKPGDDAKLFSTATYYL